MKKTLAILLAICLMFTSLFSLPVFAEDGTTFLMTELEGKYKTQGRTVFNADGVLLAHYPATGIEFNAYCKGNVSVTFSTYQPLQWKTNDCYFTVIVDGEVMPRETCHITGITSGDVTFTIANDLAEGNHTFKIYRQNEIKYAYLGFKSITLDGYLLDAPEDKDMYIEFVGASQWGGAGNLGDANSPSIDTPEVQDATQGLTYLTPQFLDADWSVVSLAGTGAYWGIEGYPMNKMYNYYGYMNDKSTLYDFNNDRTPDYVVIGLGTNDVSKAEKFGKTDEDIYDAFNYFIRLLRMKNPGAKIVWVHGMLNDQATPYVKKAVEDLGGAEYGVYEFHVEKNNDGASLHPSVEGHTRMAGEIAEFIRSIDSQEFTSEFEQKPYAPLSNGEVIMESDFDGDTNWQKANASYITYMDDNGDGTNDFARITSTASATPALLSAPFKLVHGKDYELSFWARIPKESNEFFTDTYKLYPKIALYKPTLNGDKVSSTYQESKNDYVYNQDGFTNSVWTFGSELYEFVVKKYTTLNTNNQYQAYGCMDTDKIYDGWTRVTYKFTGFSADGSTTAEDVAVSFALPKAKDSLAEAVGCMYDIKDVKLVDTSAEIGSDDTNQGQTGEVLITSDFIQDFSSTKWAYYKGENMTIEDENGDGTKDYLRLNSMDGNRPQMYSYAVDVVPGNEYELKFKMLIPEDSAEYKKDEETGTYPAPAVTIYETTNNEAGKPSAKWSEGSNEYAYKDKRRETFASTMQIGNNTPYTRDKWSVYEDVCFFNAANTTSGRIAVLNDAFKDWTDVSIKFTALADEEGETAQPVSISFAFDTKVAGYSYCVKDVEFICAKDNTVTEPENPEEPVVPETPEGALYYEHFENQTDEDVAEIITNRTWSKPFVSTTEAATGTKSLGIYGMYEYMFIPMDKALFEEGVIYEYSMDWKLKEYTADKKRAISSFRFVGYNPSAGEVIKTDAKAISYLEELKGTGDWVNSVLRLRVSYLDAYEQYGIVIRYGTSTPYSEAEDTLYIDNILLKKAEDQSVLNPLNIKEEARTENTIKVLAFGNSFSNDATTLIPQIAAADGTDIRVGDCSIGGCPIIRHYNNMFNGTTDYSFNYRQPSGTKSYGKVGMYQALTATDWDYITIQQVSGNSGKLDTFEPYLSELIKYFKEICPDAKIILHMTWAYQEGYSGLSNYQNSQSVMYEAIEDTYIAVSESYDFMPIIPSGEAIKRVRDTVVGDNLNRDGFHLNDKGRLIAALTWYEFFTGISALDAKVDLANVIGSVGDTKDVAIGITEEESLIFRTAAHEAVTHFKKANETQKAIKAIGTVTTESKEAIEKAEALRTELNDDDLLPNLQTLLDARAAYDNLAPEVIVGDLSGDGKTDLEDVILLARHFAGWDTDLDETVLDLNGDGVQNLNDLVLLAQYVAGWNVQIVK